MKAIVLVSTVYNPEEKLALNAQAFAAVHENEIPNDFDLIAVEAAVRLKEQGKLDEVIVFSLGPSLAAVQKALAMGADRAFYGACGNGDLTPQIVVDTILSVFEPSCDMVWMAGKLGVNFESHSVPQMLASRLSCPCLCSAFKIENHNAHWLVYCEDERGIPVFEVDPPFVVTAELRLAEPRFPSLPNIIKAKRKPIEMVEIASHKEISPQTVSLEPSDDGHRNCQWISIDELLIRIKEARG